MEAATFEKPWFRFYELNVRRRVEIPEITLVEMLKQTTLKFPENPALIFGGKTITYREMDSLIERMAKVLRQRGVKKGDRISIFMPNSANWVISFFAIQRVGAIVVQTNPLYVESELKALLQDSGAIGIVSIPPLLPRISPIQAEVGLEFIALDYLSKVSGLAGLGLADNPVYIDLEEKLSDPSIDELETPPFVCQSNDTAVLQYTGGTTGTAKGVMLTHYNLVANALQAWEWIVGHEGKERILTVLPLFHIYALTACMNFSILSGGAMIILPRFDIDAVLQHINDYEPTFFPGAPTMYVAVINHPRIKEYKVSSIRCCLSGSAPLPKEVAIRFGELTGGRLVEAYGLSEASPATHLNPIFNSRVGSIGVPAPNTDAKIMDLETGQKELPAGEIGELVVKGDQVMSGYWQKPEETAAVLQDGWLYTGDIAYKDEDGFFYIVDRKKDMIISGGYNVYPRDVEEVLYTHPAVREAVCAGIANPYWGEMVKAYIVTKEGSNVTEEEILNYCQDKLATFKIPKQIEFRESLPKTAVGKVLRRYLVDEERERMLLQENAGAKAEVAATEELTESINV
ncbi:long-chain-fatty-acid--CoA ligase [Desulfosporosinus youngiae]|uniref:Acyl-CoA synthetase (AMP-forming)/AMP-acid ligase II n=1 Tax=Desulfosporosinus youngiae DSM 17734 TaxID=768710 RepID=H5Y158_9FIRM|nr:long-chain fatty acid--CoA ligase [Desulfosporosinus youngiae]EHQ87396.1 acyl-CoA synthetase (AMP-forming)/AMP-acid ligase II [Desulfosporosinus youngiae DSM 17734]